jgi:hypothetical protein
MADFKVLERAGYEELDVQEQIDEGMDIGKLWAAVGRGDTTEAAIVLMEAGFLGAPFYEEDVEDVEDVVVVSVPDDRLGDRYRIWIKLK